MYEESSVQQGILLAKIVLMAEENLLLFILQPGLHIGGKKVRAKVAISSQPGRNIETGVECRIATGEKSVGEDTAILCGPVAVAYVNDIA